MPDAKSIRPALAAVLVIASSSLFAQSGSAPERWTCNLNGTDIGIRIAGDEATVTRAGGETRVLKRQEIRTGTLYTDGTVGIKYRGTAPASTNSPQWLQNGQASSLTHCLEATG